MYASPRFVRNALDAVASSVSQCNNYYEALSRALQRTEPIFTTSDYERFFWTCATAVPGWVQNVLVESAISESDGAARLRKLVQAIDYNKDAEQGLTIHARDEANHSRLFLAIARDIFPAFLSAEAADDLRSRFTPIDVTIVKSGLHLPEDVLIDYLVQINLSEVRTLMNLHLLAPILWGCAPIGKRERIEAVLRSLQRDELRHITYTANLMEAWTCDGDARLVPDLFAKNMAEFNAYSVDGTRAAVQHYGKGQFPRLLRF